MSEPPDKTAAPDSSAPTASAYADDLYCPECGYSLRGLTSDRCPECGLDLSFIESEVSIIPWEHGREVGLIKAYWKTVWLINFRGKVFHRAFYQPVSQPDSLSFRAVCIGHAFITVVLAVIMLYAFEPDGMAVVRDIGGRQFIIIACLCVLTWLFVITGLPSYIFDSRLLEPSRRDRAVALGNYTCAWLAWFPLAGVLLMLGLLLRDANLRGASVALSAAGAVAFVVFVAMTVDYERTGKRMFRGERSVWFWELKSGPVFLVATLAILAGLPVAAIMVHVLVLSLR
jgi:hypothetical protein